MDSLEGARKSKADADASLKVSNDLVAAVEAKLQQLQDKFMEASELLKLLSLNAFNNLFQRSQSRRRRKYPTPLFVLEVQLPSGLHVLAHS